VLPGRRAASAHPRWVGAGMDLQLSKVLLPPAVPVAVLHTG
jgi:hypothetical protein